MTSSVLVAAPSCNVRPSRGLPRPNNPDGRSWMPLLGSRSCEITLSVSSRTCRRRPAKSRTAMRSIPVSICSGGTRTNTLIFLYGTGFSTGLKGVRINNRAAANSVFMGDSTSVILRDFVNMRIRAYAPPPRIDAYTVFVLGDKLSLESCPVKSASLYRVAAGRWVRHPPTR